MCDFKPGDEVVCVDATAVRGVCELTEGATYTVQSIVIGGGDGGWSSLTGVDEGPRPIVLLAEIRSASRSGGFHHRRFRKVQRRNDSLSIEAFLTIKPGFEEPRRAPAKKRERVQ